MTDTQKQIKEYSNKFAKIVCSTMGKGGKYVMINNNGNPFITKDGATVARMIKGETEIEKNLYKMFGDVALKTASETGDGTTTSVCLLNSLLQNVQSKDCLSNENLNKILWELDKQSRTATKEDLLNVAITAGNGDEEIANNIVSCLSSVQNVLIKQGLAGMETTVKIDGNGSSYIRGLSDVRFGNVKLENGDDAFTAVSRVLVTNKTITDISEILHFLEFVQLEGSALVIISPEVNISTTNILLNNNENGAVLSSIVRPPSKGDLSTTLMRDLAISIGATFIDSSIKDFKQKSVEEILSKHVNVLVTEKTSQFELINEREKEHTELLEKHISEMKVPRTEYERGIEQERLTILKGGRAEITVGGESQTEIKEMFDRYEDVLGSTLQAKKSGVVNGGGVALKDVSITLLGRIPNLVRISLLSPIEQISNNIFGEHTVNWSDLSTTEHLGVDYDTQSIINFEEKKTVLDSTNTVKKSLENAWSLAKTLIHTDNYVI